MGDARLTIAGRELAVLRREKTIVLALAIQLFIAAFSSFLVVGLVSLYSPDQMAGSYTVDVGVTGDAVDDLQEATHAAGGIDVTTYTDESSARRSFQHGREDAILVTEMRGDRIHVEALAPTSNLQTTLIVVQVRDALRELERTERRQRAEYLSFDSLALPPEAQSSPYYSFTYTVLLPLLLLLPVFIGGALAVDSMTEEFERGTLELLRVAPVSLQGIVEGKLLAAVALAPAQAALWLALLWLNGTAIHNPVALLVLVTALATLVVSMGIAVSLPSGSRRAAQLIYSTGVLFLFGVASLLPGNPANVAARLAIGSGGPVPTLAVAGYVVLAVAAFVGLRAITGRVGGDLS
ncbi:MAG: ABC transporter permease [Haloferacaceae archaeon]